MKAVKVSNARTFTLVLDRAVLADLVHGQSALAADPIPQHVWDKKSASGPVGNWDTTTAGAKAVYDFLIGEAKKLSTYATNPLWQVVDGPWKLSAYRTDGYSEFVPNTRYSGPVKPKLDKFIEQPFTTAQAELNVLRSGGVDYGYLPQSEVAQAKALQAQGYTFAPWISWGINYMPFNFASPTAGPMFKQLYIRQALQMVIDQRGYVRSLLKGFGWPTFGPVPVKPANPYVSSFVENGPYEYSPDKAAALLKSHGWTIHPDGASECTGSCGPGDPGRLEARVQAHLRHRRHDRQPGSPGLEVGRVEDRGQAQPLRGAVQPGDRRQLRRASQGSRANGRSRSGAAAGSTASTRSRSAISSSCAVPERTSAPTATARMTRTSTVSSGRPASAR